MKKERKRGMAERMKDHRENKGRDRQRLRKERDCSRVSRKRWWERGRERLRGRERGGRTGGKLSFHSARLPAAGWERWPG